MYCSPDFDSNLITAARRCRNDQFQMASIFKIDYVDLNSPILDIFNEMKCWVMKYGHFLLPNLIMGSYEGLLGLTFFQETLQFLDINFAFNLISTKWMVGVLENYFV